MIREFSAGGIVFDSEGQVLIVKYSGNHKWGFPKGAIEKGESGKDAALREVKEEAGVEAEIVTKVGDSKYFFALEGEKIFKVVTIFLMNYISGDTNNHDWEVDEAGWFSPDEALKVLDYPNDKELLKKALELNGQR